MAKSIPKRNSALVDELIAVSSFVLETHRKEGYFCGVSGSVLYNINEGPDTTALEEGSHNSSLLTFGFIGSIVEEKGVESLLNATRKVTSNNWRLKIAGIGHKTYQDRLKTEYPDARIEWLGYATASKFYASVDVAITPSLWPDPLPYVVLEAIWAGKSVICASSGGIPELARLGRNVIIYDPASHDALAAAMNRVLLAPEMWRQGGFIHSESTELFSRKQIVSQHMKVYLPSK